MALQKTVKDKTSKANHSKKANSSNDLQKRPSRSGPSKHVKHTKQKPKTKPENQRIFRKAIVRNKVKRISSASEVPRLFRMDRVTGLPMDYERTVDYVMHYVNPHLTNKRSPEQMLEEKLTEMFAALVEQQQVSGYGCGMSRSLIRHKLMSQFGSRGGSTSSLAKAKRDGNVELAEFHTACKRGPRAMSETNIKSRKTKYNPYKL